MVNVAAVVAVSVLANLMHQCGEDYSDTVDCVDEDDSFGIYLFLCLNAADDVNYVCGKCKGCQ